MISPDNIKKFSIKKNVLLKKLTTLRIGGPAKYFVEVRTEKKLVNILGLVAGAKAKRYIVGSGSNLVPADKGFNGLVVKVAIGGVDIYGNKVRVGAGVNLLNFVHMLNRQGLSGMERMAGIPGTLAGAIYGNAGAYGQEIKDSIVSVRFFDGKRVVELKKPSLKLAYRTSVFKEHKDWVILSSMFKFKKSKPSELKKISKDIIDLRNKKYKPGLACPGSFFKNVVLAGLSVRQRENLKKKVPKDKIMYGKIPSAYLLEVVGAKGMKRGGIRIADYHANLLYNAGGGRAGDIKYLARILKNRVKSKFGILLEEEVQYF